MKTLQHSDGFDSAFHASELPKIASLNEIRDLGMQFNEFPEIKERKAKTSTPFDNIKNPTPRPF